MHFLEKHQYYPLDYTAIPCLRKENYLSVRAKCLCMSPTPTHRIMKNNLSSIALWI